MAYTAEFDKLNRAGVGVVLTPTREPSRVIADLMAYSLSYELDAPSGPPPTTALFGGTATPTFAFKVWDVISGWTAYTKPVNGNTSPAHEKDGMTEFHEALNQIGDLANGGQSKWGAGVYVMVYPHWHLNTPPAIQTLKEYAAAFTKDDRRLVLVVPEAYQVPQELTDDVTVLDFTPPGQDELLQSATTTLEQVNGGTCPYSDTELNRIVSAGLGMTLAEFEKTLSRAIVENEDTFPETPISDFLKVVMKAKTEVVSRTEVLALIGADDMRHVGGLSRVKEWIEERKDCLTPEAREFGIDRLRGFLAVGIPGTGKSLLAKATAGDFGVPLIQFKIARCFGSFVGESEQRTELALKYLESMAPCVAWVDEIDKAGFGGGSSRSSDTTDRVLQQLLTFMQESQGEIIWVATANRVENIPSELLRPGRIDCIFGLGLPNAKDRLEILKIHLRKRKQKIKPITDLGVAVEAGDGYTPAELESAVNSTLIHCFRHKVPVTGELIAKHIAKVKPYIKAFAKDYAHMNEWCSQYAVPASDDNEEVEKDTPLVRSIRRRVR